MIFATWCSSECGTWSHAVIPSLGARARGGWSGADVSVSHVVGPSQGSGLMGWVGSRQGTSGSHIWSRIGPYISRSYTDTGQSSDPSGLVGSLRAISGSDGFPSETCFGTSGPVGARRIARLSRIGARLMYGPLGHATASPQALRRPIGTQWTPGGPPAAPSDPL